MLQKLLAFPLAALLLGFGLSWAAATPKKKAPSKAPAAKSNVSKTPPKSTARRSVPKARTTTAYARGRTRGRSPRPVPARRYRGQQVPTQDRVTEIRQALFTRGYLQTSPAGAWDTPTVEALKRFQQEQNLPPTGKITSLSLIALGLGPKRNPLTAGAAPPQ